MAVVSRSPLPSPTHALVASAVRSSPSRRHGKWLLFLIGYGILFLLKNLIRYSSPVVLDGCGDAPGAGMNGGRWGDPTRSRSHLLMLRRMHVAASLQNCSFSGRPWC